MNRITSFIRENQGAVGLLNGAAAGLLSAVTSDAVRQERVTSGSGDHIFSLGLSAFVLSNSLFKIDVSRESKLKLAIGTMGFMAHEFMNIGTTNLPYWANRTISLLVVGGVLNLLLEQRVNKNLFIAAATQLIGFHPGAFVTLVQDGIVGLVAGGCLGHFLFQRDGVVNFKELIFFTAFNSATIAFRYFVSFNNPMPQMLDSICITTFFAVGFFSMFHHSDRQILIDENSDLAQENSELVRENEVLTDQCATLKAQSEMRTLPNTISSWFDNDPILSKFPCLITQTPCVAPVADPDGNTLYEKDQVLHWLKTKKESPANRLPLEVERLKPLPKLNALIQSRLQDLKDVCENSQKSVSDSVAIVAAREEMKIECPELAYLFDDLLPKPVARVQRPRSHSAPQRK